MVLALLATALVTLFLHRWPPSVVPRQADAMAVFAGDPNRVEEAARLVNAGVAPVLLLSDGGDPAGCAPVNLRAGRELVCFTPGTGDTVGEARALGHLLAERDIGRVGVVSTRPHLARATLLLRACTGAEVAPIAAPPTPVAAHVALWRSLHEVAGLLYEVVLRRPC